MSAYGKIEPPDSGHKCWREPDELRDGTPRYQLQIRPFWQSAEEAAAYLTAVRNHPREVDVAADQIESNMNYIVRIAGIVAQGPLGPPVQRMPSRWHQPARPIEQTPEPPYEERLDALFTPREPGEEG